MGFWTMSTLTEFLFGQKRVEIVSDKSFSECTDALQRLHRPRVWLLSLDTNVEIKEFYSDQFSVEISKRRRLRFMNLRSVSFIGVIEMNSTGKTILRGNITFQEWYYVATGFVLFATLLWLSFYPAYISYAAIMVVIFLVFATWFVRSDKNKLLQEIRYAVL
jgi:hypothetical protein